MFHLFHYFSFPCSRLFSLSNVCYHFKNNVRFSSAYTTQNCRVHYNYGGFLHVILRGRGQSIKEADKTANSRNLTAPRWSLITKFIYNIMQIKAISVQCYKRYY